MKASEVITRLQTLMRETQSDPIVLAQSHGCCSHGHGIKVIEMASEYPEEGGSGGEQQCIVVRV